MASPAKMKKTVGKLAETIGGLVGKAGDSLVGGLRLLNSCPGAIVVVAYGKSRPVGAKMVSTFRSAGRRSYLLDPVDAFYGEAAAVSGEDVAVIVAGGEADEIIRIIPWLKKKNSSIIALTPSSRSSLARAADVVIKTAAAEDSADGLAAYTQSITAMAMGDLLGLAMLFDQDVDRERAAASTGGGEAIYTIEDLLATHPGNPVVSWDTPFRDALIEMTSRGLGAISIVDDDGRLAGIITDGDLRRLMQKTQGSIARMFLTNVDQSMTKDPKRISPEKTLSEAIAEMEDNAITVLPAVDSDGRPIGMVHLHDLVQLGLLRRPPREMAAGAVKKGAGKKKSAKKSASKKKSAAKKKKQASRKQKKS